jgi:hypothetical protein
MAASDTVLIDALNRLGGRQHAVPAERDLVAWAPVDLPLVAVRTGDAPPRVAACNVEHFMARAPELEPEALGALAELVSAGRLDAAADPGADPATWVARDVRGVARQAVQWVLDHPEHGLRAQGFELARLALGA